MKTIEFGTQVQDRVSGFKGTVTGRCQYISGCSQYLITAKAKADGSLAGPEWFDENRIETIKGKRIVLVNQPQTPGCDKLAPVR